MKTMRQGLGNEGVAMIVVIVVIMLLTLIGSFMTNLTLNQQQIVTVSSGRRVQLYYRAQAGIVDANWRIRTNYLNAAAGGVTYQLDVDGDTVNDTSVTIGVPNGSGIYAISATGLDV